MNDMLLVTGLGIVVLGVVGVIRPLPFLRKNRWLGLGVFVAGGVFLILGMSRSDAGSEPGATRMLLDDYMPEYDVHEIHAIRVHASPQRIYGAIQAVTVSDLGIANGLVVLRSLPAREARGSLTKTSRRSKMVRYPATSWNGLMKLQLCGLRYTP